MPPKATSPPPPAPSTSPAATTISGKWLIIGIFGLALAAAGGSWLFRYNATHRVANLWGPKATQLIRDAPQVEFFYVVNGDALLNDPDLFEKLTAPGVCGKVDVSKARGFTHLRNALLEDRSFAWQVSPKAPPPAGWMLRFSDPVTNEQATIAFAKYCDFCILSGETKNAEMVSCEPIATGLWGMFNEFSVGPAMVPPESR